jgi:hypothetical protein
MFDKLRQQSRDPQAADAPAAEAPTWAETSDEPLAVSPSLPARARGGRRLPIISALTPAQRFILALMLFINVCLIGVFALIVFDRLPF